MPQFSDIFAPTTTAPSRFANRAADVVDPRMRDTSQEPITDVVLRAFIAGAMQGAGGEASNMTSPFGMAATALPALRGGRTAGMLSRLLGRGKVAAPIAEAAPTIARAPFPTSRAGAAIEEGIDAGPEFVPRGAEDLYNAMRIRRTYDPSGEIRRVADEAEEAYSHSPFGKPTLPRKTMEPISESMARGYGPGTGTGGLAPSSDLVEKLAKVRKARDAAHPPKTRGRS